ncbi:hypothetical protein BOO36_16995 [Vibrio navarrensis]|uniref:hypothetical protein n=1 Tax=Vibrio navarrensis TaxID=29495 RepID=UPI00186A2111|nr:hypothetical protein [Vibrio navarrensis]MBE4575501.1 hypothetical protein [Vibrio navarrensis]MBE4579883.1 hypothetical protein [Vibrio navarrensis]
MFSNEKIDWNEIERATLTLKNISSILCIILIEKERHSEEYAAIEGVAQLADFQAEKLKALIN